MAYHVYLGDTEIPIPPEKIDLKISGNNKTLTLINDGEINILKNPGLTELSFEILLPQVQYPFSEWLSESTVLSGCFGKIHGREQTVSVYCISSNAKWNSTV